MSNLPYGPNHPRRRRPRSNTLDQFLIQHAVEDIFRNSAGNQPEVRQVLADLRALLRYRPTPGTMITFRPDLILPGGAP